MEIYGKYCRILKKAFDKPNKREQCSLGPVPLVKMGLPLIDLFSNQSKGINVADYTV